MERDAVIVAGFGCRAVATTASLRAAFDAARGDHVPDALAVPVDRADLLAPLADALALPMIAIAPAAIAAQATPTRSPASLAARGTGSVAEAAALAAAGPRAAVIVTRRIAPDRLATCAIARGPQP